jgi:hypothetical protein
MPPHATIVRKQRMIVSMMKKQFPEHVSTAGPGEDRLGTCRANAWNARKGLPPRAMLPRKVDQSVNRQSELKRSSEVTDAADRRSLVARKTGRTVATVAAIAAGDAGPI